MGDLHLVGPAWATNGWYPDGDALFDALITGRAVTFTADPVEETWNRMAQRWTECAERFQHDREAVHRPALRYRKSPRAWAAH